LAQHLKNVTYFERPKELTDRATAATATAAAANSNCNVQQQLHRMPAATCTANDFVFAHRLKPD